MKRKKASGYKIGQAVQTPKMQIQDLCHYIQQNSDLTLDLKKLSAMAGISSSYLQRTFKKVIGVSPRQYQEACRFKTLKRELRSGKSVAAAVYECGFGSPSRVYERSDERLGMRPKDYRNGGQNIEISYATVTTQLGQMMLAATDRGLCFLQLGNETNTLKEELYREFPQAQITKMPDRHAKQMNVWITALHRYFDGLTQELDLPLDVQGTAFQFRVWMYLQSIPYGEVRSYSQVACEIGKPNACRAVARACATNPVAIVIPCHRVIRGNGELGGYRYGLARKRALIDQESSEQRRRWSAMKIKEMEVLQGGS